MRRLPGVDTSEVIEWWRGLAPDVRRELRRDGGRPPRRVVARFVEPDEAPAETHDEEQ
jgi:hypothetical protein